MFKNKRKIDLKNKIRENTVIPPTFRQHFFTVLFHFATVLYGLGRNGDEMMTKRFVPNNNT